MGGIHIFTLAGIPVRVSFSYFILIAYYAYQLGSQGFATAAGFIVGVTASILIHEFGHGLVARRFRLDPRIELHVWGGLCFHEHARKDSHHVLIVLCGPLLEIVVGGVVWLALTIAEPGWGYLFEGPLHTGSFASAFFYYFIFVSILWGAINLLAPIYPLDGGQLFRMGLLRLIKPAARAEKVLHVVSIACSGAVIAYGVITRSYLLAIMAGTWLVENLRYLSQGGTPTPIRLRSELADRLLAEAATALRQGEHHEARRLAFQARDEKTVTDDQLARIFEIVVVASVGLREFDEALSWSPRAPRTPAAFAARLTALCGVGKRDQARSELNASDAVRLDPAVLASIEEAMDGRGAP